MEVVNVHNNRDRKLYINIEYQRSYDNYKINAHQMRIFENSCTQLTHYKSINISCLVHQPCIQIFMQLINVYINTEKKLYVSILNIKGVMTITPEGRTKGAPRKERVKLFLKLESGGIAHVLSGKGVGTQHRLC